MKFRANSLIRSRHRFPPIVPSHVVARVLSRNSLHLPGNFPVSFTCWRREQFAPDSLLRHVVSASGCRRSLSLLLLVLPQKRPTYSKTGQRRIGNTTISVVVAKSRRDVSSSSGIRKKGRDLLFMAAPWRTRLQESILPFSRRLCFASLPTGLQSCSATADRDCLRRERASGNLIDS